MEHCLNAGEMFTFGYQEKTPHLIYRVVSKDGVMGEPVPITIPACIMMHDFAISENYALFMDLPLLLNPTVTSPLICTVVTSSR